ncbi:MAG: cupin domain-containing protein [Nitriliruptorales bacterium]|nr:cupin domain-containing protein [Nitriliruptorales bacterium]
MTVEMDAERIRRMAPAERDGYAQVIADQVVRFREVQPNWEAFAEARLPGNERGFYGYVGTGASTDPRARGAIPQGDNFSFSIVLAGRGARLHAHTTEEVFIPLTGEWIVYWGEPHAEEQVLLERWDAVSVPAPVMRGFRNAGTEDAYLLALLGGGAPPPPIYHESVIERLERWHPNIDQR